MPAAKPSRSRRTPPMPKAVIAAVEKTVATFGRLDVLVNNAGTAIPKPFEETTLEEMDRVIDINLRGVLIATQAALKHLPDGGRIITIGSCVGERMMTPGLVAYAATKGAVKMFTQGLSREVGARGITVNNIQPGPIDTDLNPCRRRLGDAADRQYGAEALRPCRRYRRHGRVRRRPGSQLHHRRQPDRRWRHQRVRRDT
jgi:3-oxoacyl-[acyl-carrier protein] reductase